LLWVRNIYFFVLNYILDIGIGGDGLEKYDWEKIKLDYVTGNMSYSAIIKKYGVSKRMLADRASKGNWVELREKHRNNLYSKSYDLVFKDRVKKLSKLISASDKLAGIVNSQVMKIEKLEKASDEPINTQAIKNLTLAAKELTNVIRNLNNIPTEAEYEALNIAKQKLAMDKSKSDDETEEIRIVFDDDTEEFAE
jgi:hypothetical protein